MKDIRSTITNKIAAISSKDAEWMLRQAVHIRTSLLLSCSIGIMRTLLSLGFIVNCKTIVDIATGRREGNMELWMGLMAALLVGQILMAMMLSRLNENSRVKLSNHIQKRLFAKVMLRDLNVAHEGHSGDSVNRLVTDVATISDCVCVLVPQLVLTLFQLGAATWLMFTMQPALAWVLLIIMPVAIIVSKVYYIKLRQMTANIRNTEGKVQSLMQEGLLKRLVIRCMCRVDDTVSDLGSLHNDLATMVKERVNVLTQARAFVQAGFMTGYAVTFCWGAYGLMAGTITYGMMTAFLQLVNQIQSPIVNISHAVPSIIQALTSATRLRELDDQLASQQEEDKHMEGIVGIRFEDVTFTYPGNQEPTIQHLTYDFKPGTSTAVIGETGAGKSTMIKLMLGLLRPDSGRVIIYDDTNEEEVSTAHLCNYMYVPQGNSLLSGTIADNLRMGNPHADVTQMRDALEMADAVFAFDLDNGLDTQCCELGARLSEGQSQRIAIARAMLQSGGIMVLDEATSALDRKTESRVISNLMAVHNKTNVWITHHAAVSESVDNILEIM